MGEFVRNGEGEVAIANDPKAFEVAEEAATGVLTKENEEEYEGEAFSGGEDFTDPTHPLYGTVDEHGRALPGWLDQITFRQDTAFAQLWQARPYPCC